MTTTEHAELLALVGSIKAEANRYLKGECSYEEYLRLHKHADELNAILSRATPVAAVAGNFEEWFAQAYGHIALDASDGNVEAEQFRYFARNGWCAALNAQSVAGKVEGSTRCPTCDGPCDMFEEEGTFEIAYIYRSTAK